MLPRDVACLALACTLSRPKIGSATQEPSIGAVSEAGKQGEHLKAAWRLRKIRQFIKRSFGEYARLRKWIVGLLGASTLIIGAAMVFLPGPAIIVIPAGLAILATEFAWARRLLRRVKKQFNGRAAARNDDSRRNNSHEGEMKR